MKALIIAEAGVNHNGSLRLAKKLVDAAKKAKADYVKFQSFNHEKLTTKNAPKAEYQKSNSKKKQTQSSMLKSLELSKSEQINLIKYCKKKKIKFLCTAFDEENLQFLIKEGIDYIKIPSGEITNLPFLKFIKKKQKKILLSTGASNIKDIANALKILNNKKKITILHCNSAYPTPTEDINLNSLRAIKEKFNCAVGLSDHSLSLVAPSCAVAIGATVIEKHFTLNRKFKGPDHKSSLEPNDLSIMIKNIREIENSLGKKEKIVTKSEKKNRDIIRKSIVASTDIKKGDRFSLKNLAFKRPGYGISPMHVKKVLGKRSKKHFKKDDFIKL
jgi:N,N'-diacetyllegionaminate synthase